MRPPPAWLKRLARAGAIMAPVRIGGGWAIYPKGDRRRRPSARLSDVQRREAAAQGWIETGPDRDETCWFISEAGRTAIERRRAGGDFAAPHRDLVPRNVVSPVPGKNTRTDTVLANAAESPLWRWRKSGAISSEAFEAGERLRSDYARSSLAGRTTIDWTRPAAGRRSAPSPDAAPLAALAAKDRVMAALAAAGDGLADILVAACIREEGAGALERRFGWKRGGAGAVLAIALHRLAIHYGLTRPGGR